MTRPRDPFDPPPHCGTTITNVREVSLHGTADLEPWTETLAGESLVPYRQDERADLLIMACAGSFLGVRFRELSISIAVSRRDDGSTRDGVYLAHAFNSVRVFALIERTFFRAPYFKAAISVETSPHVFLEAKKSERVVLRADMAEASPVAKAEDDGWEGAVFLPRSLRRGDRLGMFFYAKLHGPTRSQPFSPSSDRVELSPDEQDHALRLVASSNFKATEWQIRERAVHSKSRSYARH